MPRLIAAALPLTSGRHRAAVPSPEFLSHWPALLIRAANHTLAIPDHPAYVLDTRMAQHARAEVLLRRHHSRIQLVVAQGRFPHAVGRLKPLLSAIPVVDVRRWPDDPDALWRRSRRCLLTTSALNGCRHDRHPCCLTSLCTCSSLGPYSQRARLVDDPTVAGFFVPSPDIHDRAFFLRSWLPVLTAVPDHMVVLQVPPKGELDALWALQTLRATAPGRGAHPPCSPDGHETVNSLTFRQMERAVGAPACFPPLGSPARG